MKISCFLLEKFPYLTKQFLGDAEKPLLGCGAKLLALRNYLKKPKITGNWYLVFLGKKNYFVKGGTKGTF